MLEKGDFQWERKKIRGRRMCTFWSSHIGQLCKKSKTRMDVIYGCNTQIVLIISGKDAVLTESYSENMRNTYKIIMFNPS